MTKTDPDSVSPESLLEGANDYFQAAITLCEKHGQAIDPIGLLSSHSLEVALKAALLKTGSSEKDLKAIGHDLVAAWQKAAPVLGLSVEPPYWVKVLHFSHCSPYYFRYSPGEFRVAIPNCEELREQLENVLHLVRAKVSP